MICADFLAGANLEDGDPEILLNSLRRFFLLMPAVQRELFRREIREAA
jgi:hypothetical protein